jgi:RNA polymerase sigma-70 factor (ECF subfamily)
VEASHEAVTEVGAREYPLDLEAIFEAQYRHIVRAIVLVIRDPGRAEELAVDVFLKWSRHHAAHGPNARGWLYRTAARLALDELRRQASRNKYDPAFSAAPNPPGPDAALASCREQEKVRAVLAGIAPRSAEMLLLRSQGLDYQELAAVLDLNPGSVGTLLRRAQQAFRKEYIKRYGEQ